MPKDVVGAILELLPLDDVTHVRQVSKEVRAAADGLIASRGLSPSDEMNGNARQVCREKLDICGSAGIGAATWLCNDIKASWLHQLACVGSPDQVALALHMGEPVNPPLEGIERAHATFGRCITPLTLACMLGRAEVVKVLLKASVRG